MTSLAMAHTTLLVTQVTWLVFESSLDDGICHVFTFTLHFTLLSCIGWMFVEGIVLYKFVYENIWVIYILIIFEKQLYINYLYLYQRNLYKFLQQLEYI